MPTNYSLAVENQGDERCHVAHVQSIVAVHVGIIGIERGDLIAQHLADEGRHVTHVNTPVAVHVTSQAGVLVGEVARVAGTAVDVGIGLIHRVGGTVGRALAAH